MTSFPSDAKSWLGKLVSFDTTSYKSNLSLLDYVRDYLKTFNIESVYVYNPEKTHANLFATIPASDGTTQGGIILSGHTDVVPVDGQKWNTDPFTMIEKDGKLFGRGTCDMKGFLAVALSLVPMFVKMHKSKPIHFAFSFNEEVGCTGVPFLTTYLKDKGFKADCCLVGDGGFPTEIVTGNKGFASWKIIVHGKAIHSSLALMNTSCNAIEYAAKIITKIRKIALKLREEGPHDKFYTCPFPCITTGLIKGGNAVNTVPAECEFIFSLRITDTQTSAKVEQQLQSYINDVILPEMRKEYADASVKMEADWYLFPFNADEAHPFTKMGREITQDYEVRKMGGGTEAGYFQQVLEIPTFICGVGGVNAHLANEFTTPSLLAKNSKFTAELVRRVCCADDENAKRVQSKL